MCPAALKVFFREEKKENTGNEVVKSVDLLQNVSITAGNDMATITLHKRPVDKVNQVTLGRTRGGGGGVVVDATPDKVFPSFFLEGKTSVPDVFSSCSFIPRAHFETSLVMVSCYGYEIRRHK